MKLQELIKGMAATLTAFTTLIMTAAEVNGPDWDPQKALNTKKNLYKIVYGVNIREFFPTEENDYILDPLTVYFKSEEDAQKVIDKLGKEFFKKLYLDQFIFNKNYKEITKEAVNLVLLDALRYAPRISAESVQIQLNNRGYKADLDKITEYLEEICNGDTQINKIVTYART